MPPVITAGIPTKDDCPILTRLKAFVVDQGVVATLQHTLRDRKGKVINLASVFPESSVSASDSPAAEIKLRVKEFLGNEVQTAHNPVWEIDGQVDNAGKGTIAATLNSQIVERAGIYELTWAVLEGGQPTILDRGLLSIERSLWAQSEIRNAKGIGPPTLQEIRMRMMDSSAAENLLLDSVEFADEQIMLAMSEPIRAWNESPPPLRDNYTTKNFPFRGAWISGVLAQLHLMAANFYRRNRLAHSAGGTAVDDLNKEREYMAEGTRLWTEYMQWMRMRKIQINIGRFAGQVISPYSGLRDW